jgi:hypothetical protein
MRGLVSLTPKEKQLMEVEFDESVVVPSNN